jgi:hypothetical protein
MGVCLVGDDVEGLAVELHCAHAIALDGVDDPAAAPMRTAAELAGDHESLMVDGRVALRHRREDDPIRFVRRDDVFAIGVDAALLVQLLHAVEGALKVLCDLARVVRCVVERQRAKLHERVFEIAVIHELASLLPLRRRRLRRLRLSAPRQRRPQYRQNRRQLPEIRHELPPEG